MHYADSMLYITIVNILATFTIECLKDEEGKDILPPLNFNDGSVRCARISLQHVILINLVLFRCVDRFKCRITPRNDEARSLIIQQAS
jgi:hypothetical protein